MTEEEQIEAVKRDSWAIGDIENPSEKVQILVVNKNGRAIRYIKNPSEKVQMLAVKRTWRSIMDIENPSEKIQIEAVNENCWAIGDIENPSEKAQILAVNKNGWAMEYIKNPSEKVQLEAKCTLDNFPYDIEIFNKDKITIGCTILSYKEWLEYDSSYCDFVNKTLKRLIRRGLDEKELSDCIRKNDLASEKIKLLIEALNS